jgi:Predicted transcriptional regulators
MASFDHLPMSESSALTPWEIATIELFVRAAGMIGLPKSIGEIYGLLFCSAQPLSFDELEARLQISRGSVSQGLKILRQIGAIKLSYVPGSRKDHYQAELSMKRLIRGFAKDQFSPHLDSGLDRLNAIESLVRGLEDPAQQAHAAKRLETLRTWHQRTQKLLPVVMAVLGGASLLRGDSGEADRVI